MKTIRQPVRALQFRAVLFIVFLAGLLVLAYWPALRGGFIWDDDAYVTDNPMLSAPDGWRSIWFSAHRQSQFFPLVYSTLRLEYTLWGLNPLGYHLVNLVLHAINALLVWRVLKRLTVPGAWIAAGLFAFHPVQVESVAWISELKNVQSTLFYLLSLLAWLRFIETDARSRWGTYGLALFFYLLALLSKTTTCTLPAALLLAVWMRGEKITARRMGQVVPFVALGVAAGLLSIWWESHLGNYRENVGQHLTGLQRVLLASHALWFYVSKLLCPVNLTFSYPHWGLNVGDAANYLWLAGCAAVVVAGYIFRKKLSNAMIAAVIFFVATLSPLLGFIPLYTFLYSYVADHYQYVACIGLFCLAADGLRRLPTMASISVLILLAAITWQQAHAYHDIKTLWRDTLVKNPASWFSHNNLGMILKEEGNTDEAVAHYQEAIRLHHDYANPNYNLGIIYYQRGQVDEALKHFQETVRLTPDDSEARNNFGATLRAKGRLDEAIEQFRAAIRLNQDYPLAQANLERTVEMKQLAAPF